MTWVLAEHANHATAADDFALLTDLLDAGSDLHSCLVELELFPDAAARRVMFENADDDGIPFEQPDDSVPRLFVQPRSEHPPVVEADSKQ